MGYSPGEKKGSRNLVDTQGSFPLSSEVMHPEEEIQQKCLEAYMDEQGAPRHQTKP